MRWSRGVLAIAISVVISGCASTPPPVTDPFTRSVLEASQKTDLRDEDFETFLSALLRANAFGAYGDQAVASIHASRAAAVGQLNPSSSTSASPRQAALAYATTQVLMPGYYAELLAMALDPETKGGRNGSIPTNNVKTSTDTAQAITTVTTLKESRVISISGSRVQVDLSWSLTTVNIENSTQATLAEVSDERTMSGSIDVCPDDKGNVPSALKVDIKLKATTNGRTHLRTVKRKSEFAGEVDNNAQLTKVHQTFSDNSSWEGDISGGVDYGSSIDWTPSGNGIGSFNAQTFNPTRTTHGDVPEGLDNVLTWAQLLDKYAVSKPFDQAQRLWRNGRCVMVTAPDYQAETPVDLEAQGKSQHDQAVDVGSETPFKVGLKHRFAAGALKQPIDVVAFAGEKKLEPRRLENEGQLTYTAPDDEDKKATVTLKSTSKRGIGTLVLDFHTGGALTLTINGEVTGNSSYLGTVRVLDIVKIGPLQFKKFAGDIWQAAGTWTAETSSFTTVPGGGGSDTCTGTESGTITLMATVETRGKQRVWVIDPSDADVEGKGTTTCQSSLGDQTLRGVTIPGKRTYDSDGGSAELFMGNLDPFTLPADGGTVHVRGTNGTAAGSFSSDGTASARR